jgi:hypothetical protein
MAPGAINGEGARSTVNGVNGADGLSNGPPPHNNVNGTSVPNGVTNGDQPHVNTMANGTANGLTNGHTSEPASPVSSRPTPPQMPIAIVGMSCRLPGNVSTPGEFWEMLARARSGYSAIPKERFEVAPFHHPNPGKAGCANPVGGHFLDVDLESFDAPFFSLTEKEAISMDPQQRLLLEGTFEALEHAGIPKQTIVGKDVGVFIGGSFPEYESHLFRDSDTIPMHQATGT